MEYLSYRVPFAWPTPCRMLVSRPCRAMKVIRPRNLLPVCGQPFEHAVVRVHYFANLLIIALRQRIAAKRDDAPAAEARGRCLFVLHEYRPVIVWPCPRPRPVCSTPRTSTICLATWLSTLFFAPAS